MECAAVFTAAAVRGVRAGAALAVVNAAPTVEAMPDPGRLPIDALVEVAVDAVRRMIAAGPPPEPG
jgi:uridine phosphorylase